MISLSTTVSGEPGPADPISVGVTTRILGILEKVFDDVCKH